MLRRWLVLFAAALLITAGCSKKEPVVQNNEEPNHDVTGEPQQEEKEQEYSFYYPLTGIGTEEAADGRAVAVMVNNHPAARPQSGLNKADIVYEVLAEGNVNRFLAIFQSEQPERIGPVRSARDYYIELAKGYDSMYVAHGNSLTAERLLKSGYIDNLNGLYYDGTLFERVSFRKAPHNSYISFANILKGAEQKDYDMEDEPDPLTFLSETEVEKLAGAAVKKVSISYHDQLFNSSFAFDEETQKYKRFSNGAQTVDYDTDEPVLVDNIFVVETAHKIVSDVGHREIDLTSGGRAFLFQKGQMFEVEWENAAGRILPYLNGKPVGLVPGKTWINIIPVKTGLDQDVTYE
ncbi:DUF3048 domain-containing protein [Bacillus benzoevorans]|uniref:Lipoprotein YerB n=1 Tax=Bacillus benzoevorans TaxID=1456 RepID=A0A7X0HVR7_9BACI|nr:DUF3048 domain-containing protein [Bacillus benzoevorans]MBB6447759.1 hypothetical protein [Bacillus benzoevorans]